MFDNKWLHIIVVFGTAIGISVIMLNMAYNVGIEYDKRCDEKYGVDMWYLNETTGTLKTSFGTIYMGQSWECVSKVEVELYG